MSLQEQITRVLHRLLYVNPRYSPLYGADLAKLALAFKTDKETVHHYASAYQRHFEPLRGERLNLLEIGIGGYEDPKAGGGSLRMWKAYFPNARIFGMDIYDKTALDEDRIKTFKGSQVDEAFLKRVAAEIGSLDIVIDDGSHLNEHVLATFKSLFPLLSARGIYVIEDTQTSYWDDVAGQRWGGSMDAAAPHTSMNFLKRLADGLNYEEYPLDEYAPSYFDRHVVSVHFYHNLAFIHKGVNDEGSNIFGKRFR